MVILPPMGIGVTDVKPRVMVLLLDVNLPGTLSSANVKAISKPALIWAPSFVRSTAVSNCLSVDVAIFTTAFFAITAAPVVIVPAAKVNV